MVTSHHLQDPRVPKTIGQSGQSDAFFGTTNPTTSARWWYDSSTQGAPYRASALYTTAPPYPPSSGNPYNNHPPAPPPRITASTITHAPFDPFRNQHFPRRPPSLPPFLTGPSAATKEILKVYTQKSEKYGGSMHKSLECIGRSTI